ncbi:putative uncharacterized protein C8orf44 [Plecturocebus cupreus]
MPINLALWEAKAGESPEVGSSRPAWPTRGNPVSIKNTKVAQHGGTCLKSQLLRRLRQENRLNPGEVGSHYVTQAGPQLLGSSRPPASASQKCWDDRRDPPCPACFLLLSKYILKNAQYSALFPNKAKESSSLSAAVEECIVRRFPAETMNCTFRRILEIQDFLVKLTEGCPCHSFTATVWSELAAGASPGLGSSAGAAGAWALGVELGASEAAGVSLEEGAASELPGFESEAGAPSLLVSWAAGAAGASVFLGSPSSWPGSSPAAGAALSAGAAGASAALGASPPAAGPGAACSCSGAFGGSALASAAPSVFSGSAFGASSLAAASFSPSFSAALPSASLSGFSLPSLASAGSAWGSLSFGVPSSSAAAPSAFLSLSLAFSSFTL